MNKKFRISSFLEKPEKAAYIFIFPSLLIFLVFIVIPLIASVAFSMFDMNIFLKDVNFTGFNNFKRLFQDDRFWNAMLNTIYFTLLVVPLQVILALVVGVYVKKNTFFRKMLRSLYFIPVICSMTAMGILWSMLVDPTLGSIPYFLKLIGINSIGFLKDPNWAMPTIIAITVWKNFGYSMVILVVGMQNIPDMYYEAAKIDGANGWNQFKKITIPMLVPVLGFCFITNTISSMQVFDQTYVMTQGGPLYRTETLVQYIYTKGFAIAPYEIGYSSAIAQALFLIIAIISIAMYKFSMSKETGGL